MSDFNQNQQVSNSTDCPNIPKQAVQEKLLTREAIVGEHLIIRRALPHRQRRMIGAWCFLDHFGPVTLKHHSEFSIGPHPHIGLQTFTYLFKGTILHRDSLGYEQIIMPGAVNLMTAGNGIAHSEESVVTEPMELHGLQLWIALPDQYRQITADFNHYEQLPTVELNGFSIEILAGNFLNQTAATKIYSPLMSAIFACNDLAETEVALNPAFEYGLLVCQGEVFLAEEKVVPGELIYLGQHRKNLKLKASKDSKFLLLGGELFQEEILLWWNFVARTEQEIITALADWHSNRRFGTVPNARDAALTAPIFKPK